MSRLLIEAVSRTFPGVRGAPPTRALEPTSLAVADNDFICLLGPSGCGKSTLLRIVAGLDAPTAGRVLIPGAAPEIAEVLRTVLGWAWTYVIVAELIGASSGIGHMITDSQALLATDQIIFGIIVIGVIGLVSDFAFKAFNRQLFPWAQLGR